MAFQYVYLPVHNNNNYIINVVIGFRFHLMRHCGSITRVHDYCIIYLYYTMENTPNLIGGSRWPEKKSKSKPIDHLTGGEKRNSSITLTSRANQIKREI